MRSALDTLLDGLALKEMGEEGYVLLLRAGDEWAEAGESERTVAHIWVMDAHQSTSNPITCVRPAVQSTQRDDPENLVNSAYLQNWKKAPMESVVDTNNLGPYPCPAGNAAHSAPPSEREPTAQQARNRTTAAPAVTSIATGKLHQSQPTRAAMRIRMIASEWMKGERVRMSAVPCACTRSRNHAKCIHVEIQQGFLLHALVRVLTADADDLLERGHVKTVTLRLSIDFLLVRVAGGNLFFHALDALDKGAELIGCNAVFNGHSLHHLALLSEGAGAFHLPGLLNRAAIAAASVGAVCQSRAVEVEEQAAWMLEAHEARRGIGANAEEPVWRGYAGADGIGDHAVALSWDGAGSTKMRERSGRSTCREMPVTRSTSITLS